MTDLEITTLCAEARGLSVYGEGVFDTDERACLLVWQPIEGSQRRDIFPYTPLQNSAEAFELLAFLRERGVLTLTHASIYYRGDWNGLVDLQVLDGGMDALRRFVCICAAEVQRRLKARKP